MQDLETVNQPRRRRLLLPLWVVLAVFFLIEAWLWDHLEPIVARVVALIPLAALKRWLALRVGALSPALTLIVFVVPAILLFPLKLAGLWFISHGRWIAATFTVVAAKLFGLGVTAFLFDITRDKLLRMPWFKWGYDSVLRLREMATALVDPIRRRIRARIKAVFGRHGEGWGANMLRRILRWRRSLRQARSEP
ncbi:MAG: hypothetical protein FWD68_14665 [Alphaproteobacteria bacterium]|nr:hypothetical protein [Alphaproteobacteria bacterium]